MIDQKASRTWRQVIRKDMSTHLTSMFKPHSTANVRAWTVNGPHTVKCAYIGSAKSMKKVLTSTLIESLFIEIKNQLDALQLIKKAIMCQFTLIHSSFYIFNRSTFHHMLRRSISAFIAHMIITWHVKRSDGIVVRHVWDAEQRSTMSAFIFSCVHFATV